MKRYQVKLGRTQSMMGFIVGLIFCFIGLFIVIPSAGLFGLLWTGIAVVITVSHGLNAFTDKGVSSHEVIVEEELRKNQREEEEGVGDVAERLTRISSLYQDGLITVQEYEAKRKEILERI